MPGRRPVRRGRRTRRAGRRAAPGRAGSRRRTGSTSRGSPPRRRAPRRAGASRGRRRRRGARPGRPAGPGPRPWPRRPPSWRARGRPRGRRQGAVRRACRPRRGRRPAGDPDGVDQHPAGQRGQLGGCGEALRYGDPASAGGGGGASSAGYALAPRPRAAWGGGPFRGDGSPSHRNRWSAGAGHHGRADSETSRRAVFPLYRPSVTSGCPRGAGRGFRGIDKIGQQSPNRLA